MSQADRTADNVEPLFHPLSHYDSPGDVLEDARLSTEEKRVILSCWASDMYVVHSDPTLREIPGIPHRLRLDDILAALKRLDDDTDPPPRGGWPCGCLASARSNAPRSTRLSASSTAATRRYRSMQVSRPRNHLRWTREANVRRYRKLLNTQLTDLERSFVERRLAEELRDCSLPLTTMEGIDVC
jgi:hypothetical protein